MHVHIYPGKLMVTYQHITNLMDSPRTRFYVNHSEVVTWTWSHWSHSSVMGSLVNVWTSAEAIGTSPQLRDDIHRVLSRANDAFEDQKNHLTWPETTTHLMRSRGWLHHLASRLAGPSQVSAELSKSTLHCRNYSLFMSILSIHGLDVTVEYHSCDH